MKKIYFILIITILSIKLIETDALCSKEGDTCFFFSCCDGSECKGIFKRECIAIPNSHQKPHPTIKPTTKLTTPKDKLTTSEISTTPLSTTTTTSKPPRKESTTIKFITEEYLRKQNLTDGLDNEDNLNEMEDENLESNDKIDNIEGQ